MLKCGETGEHLFELAFLAKALANTIADARRFLDLRAQINQLPPQYSDVDSAATSQTPSSNAAMALRVKALTYQDRVRVETVLLPFDSEQLATDAGFFAHLASQRFAVVIKLLHDYHPEIEMHAHLRRWLEMHPSKSDFRMPPITDVGAPELGCQVPVNPQRRGFAELTEGRGRIRGTS